MGVKQETRQSGQATGVNWAIPPEVLDSSGLPRQYTHRGRAVAAYIGNERTVAIGVFAITQPDLRPSRFFIRRGRSKPTEGSLQLSRQVVRPPVHRDPILGSSYVDKLGRLPYVILKDRTPYAIGAWVPEDLIGEWSGLRERSAGGGLFKLTGEREIYQERRTLALLVRVDGENPLAERQKERYEMFLAVPEPEIRSGGDIFVVFKDRVIEGGPSGNNSDLGNSVRRDAGVQGLEFVRLKGRARRNSNPDKGLLEVVVAGITEDVVRERIYKPLILSSSSGGWDEPVRAFSFKGIAPGETRFAQERREQVMITTVRDPEPLARLRLKLVARRGFFPYRMTEAAVSSKKTGKNKSGE